MIGHTSGVRSGWVGLFYLFLGGFAVAGLTVSDLGFLF